MTDDQGYGDLGLHGNELIETPELDSFAAQGIEMTQFYVSPVCAPTRASLMTGRYNYRTGVTDTYLGRALMHSEEVTLAEMLQSAGYTTAIFGKWHLGDNYPLRAMDQGFQESLVHRGGGIGQPSDPPGNSYFDPILLKNGVDIEARGYCTDIFFEAAIDFLEGQQNRPFFLYLATNAPHTPLQIGQEWVAPYMEKGLDETTAKVYGMIANIDWNMGRLLTRMQELELERQTIVIFMTDNGHQQPRYSAGLRGRKASVFEGGIRVPFFIRWEEQFDSSVRIDRIAAHIDVAPTILDLCGVKQPAGLRFDGISLAPLLRDPKVDWPDRLLFSQSHRGDIPDMGRACSARSQRWKLVQAEGWQPGPPPENPHWALYDMPADPGEQKDLSEENPEVAQQMRKSYEDWFQDVSSTRGYDPPRIHLGTENENPATLTRQDWRGPKASWRNGGLGHWEVDVKSGGLYLVRFRFPPVDADGTARLLIGTVDDRAPIEAGDADVTFERVQLPVGPGRLEAILDMAGTQIGVHYVDVERLR
jgi:arylsulfatase A-like enzyme